jgi:hypothetical protein
MPISACLRSQFSLVELGLQRYLNSDICGAYETPTSRGGIAIMIIIVVSVRASPACR